MPLYLYRCPNDHNFERVLSVKDYDTLQYCECGQKAQRQVCAPALIVVNSFENYESPIDGSHITSEKQRREEMARNDCVAYEPTMKEESTKIMKEGEAELDKEVDRTVDEAWSKMDSSQRESLAKDICSGADINYLRGS